MLLLSCTRPPAYRATPLVSLAASTCTPSAPQRLPGDRQRPAQLPPLHRTCAAAASPSLATPTAFFALQGREAIAAKLSANIITEAGADRVLAMDLHSGQCVGYFDIPVDHVYGDSGEQQRCLFCGLHFGIRRCGTARLCQPAALRADAACCCATLDLLVCLLLTAELSLTNMSLPVCSHPALPVLQAHLHSF